MMGPTRHRGCGSVRSVTVRPTLVAVTSRPAGRILLRVAAVLKVFLVDDHEVVRRGVADLLEEEDDLTVVGEAGSVAEALIRVPAARPDIAVLDMRLPDGNGVELCRDLRSMIPDLNCLMLTSFTDEQAMMDAILAGAGGFVIKDIKGMELVSAVRTVGSGGSLLNTRAASAVREELGKGRGQGRSVGGLDVTGTRCPGTHRRGTHQSADRGPDVSRRENRQELRVGGAGEAGPRPAYSGRSAGHRVARPGPPLMTVHRAGLDHHHRAARVGDDMLADRAE